MNKTIMMIMLSYRHFRVNKINYSLVHDIIQTSSFFFGGKSRRLNSLSNVANTFRQASVLIKTPAYPSSLQDAC